MVRGYVGWGLLGHVFDNPTSGALVPGKAKTKPAPEPEKAKKKHAKNTRGDPENTQRKHVDTLKAKLTRQKHFETLKTNTPKTRRKPEKSKLGKKHVETLKKTKKRKNEKTRGCPETTHRKHVETLTQAKKKETRQKHVEYLVVRRLGLGPGIGLRKCFLPTQTPGKTRQKHTKRRARVYMGSEAGLG